MVFTIILTSVTLLLAAYPLAVFIKKKLNIQFNPSALFSIGLFILISRSLFFYLIRDSYFLFEFNTVLLIVDFIVLLFAHTLFVLAFLNRDKTKRTWQSLCDISLSIIGFVIPCCYFVLGCFQTAEVYSGCRDYLDLHWIFAASLSMVLGWFPIIGTVFGIFGAVKGWGWSWTNAILLFTIPLIFFLLAFIVDYSFEKFSRN